MSANQPAQPVLIPAFLRDIRFLQAVGQIIVVILVVAAVAHIATAILNSLNSKNLTPNLTFLQNRAGFDISEKPDWYTSDSSYGEAFQVGLINTARVISVGLVLTTILGGLVGVFLLSSNWLVRTISQVYVEILRNTPLLVQLFVWYFVVMLSLPGFQQPLTFPSEGISQIPIRWGIYLLAYIAARRWTNHMAAGDSRRAVVLYGLLALVVGAEAQTLLRPDLMTLYTLISLVITAITVFEARRSGRWWLVGLAGGQFLGVLLRYTGILPAAALRLELYPAVYISVRGFAFPEVLPTARFANWAAFVGLGVALALVMWVYFGRITETTGQAIPRGRYGLIAIIVFAVIGWMVAGAEPAPSTVPVVQDDATVYLPLEQARQEGLLTKADQQLYSQQPLLVLLPEVRRNRTGLPTGFDSGAQVTPEYMALLLGLVVYTSAFIAEIVRAGILAVPRGQVEASRALGLTTGQTLRMVILPQALRVIIPPMANQYLNLSKNSSLAVAVAYADLVLVTQTITNQSGQSVTGISMLMLTYLIISLAISAFTNWFNRRYRIVTR